MKIFSPNDFWLVINNSFGKPLDNSIVTEAAARPRPDRADENETSQILDEDSGLIFSNRFLYDDDARKAILDKILKYRKEINQNFDKTKAGKQMQEASAAAKALLKQAESGKIDAPSKPKVEKRPDAMSDDDAAALLAEIEEKAEQVAKEPVRKQTPSPSSSTSKSFNLRGTLEKLVEMIDKFREISKKQIEIMLSDTERALTNLGDYRGETLGEIYRRVVVPKETDSRSKMERMYIEIAGIMDQEKLISEVGRTDAFKTIAKTFKSTSEMHNIDTASEPNGGADILERMLALDELPKAAFKEMANVVKKQGEFVGKMGKFSIKEKVGGNFIIDGKEVTKEEIDSKYEEFLRTLPKIGVTEKIFKYFESLEQRDDMGAVLNKYICIRFMQMLPSLKKLSLKDVFAEIDNLFTGTEFVNLFKNIIKTTEMFAPAIETNENERMQVDQNASIQIYESNGEYYVVLYYGSQPPKRFSLDNISHRGYSNAIIKKMLTNKSEALQDVYKKLINIQVRNEINSGRVKDPSQSAYRDSKYFAQTVHDIDEESKKYTMSQLDMWKIVTASGFTGKGQPSYADEPLSKFTISAMYGGVHLFIEFSKLSDSTFRVSRVDYASGDKATASRIINAIHNKTGVYDFDTKKYSNAGNLSEGQRREMSSKITSYYLNFLSQLMMSAPAPEAAPAPAAQTAPAQSPVTQSKGLSEEELLNIYNEFNALLDKENRSPQEEKRFLELEKIVSDNINDIKNLDVSDLEKSHSLLEQTESVMKKLPTYEQNALLKRLDQLQDQLDSGKVSADNDAKIKQEIDKITKVLVERGDFSSYRDTNVGIEKLESDLLDLSISDSNPSKKTRDAAMSLLKYSPMRQKYKDIARANLDKYPHLKSYLENIYAPEFVRLVYEN
jgi:hypothetical protein